MSHSQSQTTYESLLKKLFEVNLFGGMKLGLDNCLQLQSLLNFPDRSFASVHVAGTNGKGTVVSKIAYALQAQGYKTALYTSPHISSFRERIRIDGQMIPRKEVEEMLSFLFQLTEKHKIPATFFELTTFLAFLYFAKEKVDVAVLETGLGGRLDATNIVTPLLSVITSISLDHTDTLGKTIEAIAEQKAGIIKPKVPVVIGPRVPLDIIQDAAQSKQSPCYQVKGNFANFEEENTAVSKKALELLAEKIPLSQEAIEAGLAKGKQPCRFEVIQKGEIPVILDVGHNPDGLQQLFHAVRRRFPHSPLRLVFGLSKSKDLEGCLAIIKQYGSAFHLVEAPNGRGVSCFVLQEALNKGGIENHRLLIDPTISSTIERALAEAQKEDQVLVICGSFFIMSEARQALGFQEECDAIDMNER